MKLNKTFKKILAMDESTFEKSYYSDVCSLYQTTVITDIDEWKPFTFFKAVKAVNDILEKVELPKKGEYAIYYGAEPGFLGKPSSNFGDLLRQWADIEFAWDDYDICLVDSEGNGSDWGGTSFEELSSISPNCAVYKLDIDKLCDALDSLHPSRKDQISLLDIAYKSANDDGTPFPHDEGQKAFYRFGVRDLPQDKAIALYLENGGAESSDKPSQEDWDM